MDEAHVPKELRYLGWWERADGLWQTDKPGLLTKTRVGVTMREAASIEAISYSRAR